ncbi:MAG: hypothetical protein ACHQ7M_02750 [Chloroflexota bacterium]
MNESNREKLDAFLSQRRAQAEEAKRMKDAQQARASSARDRFLELKTLVIQPTMAAISQYVADGEKLEITEQSDQNTRQGTSTDAQISIHTGKAEDGRFNPTSLSFVYRGGDKVALHRKVGANGGPVREILLSDVTSDLVETELVEWLDLVASGARRSGLASTDGAPAASHAATTPGQLGRSPTGSGIQSGPRP